MLVNPHPLCSGKINIIQLFWAESSATDPAEMPPILELDDDFHFTYESAVNKDENIVNQFA